MNYLFLCLIAFLIAAIPLLYGIIYSFLSQTLFFGYIMELFYLPILFIQVGKILQFFHFMEREQLLEIEQLLNELGVQINLNFENYRDLYWNLLKWDTLYLLFAIIIFLCIYVLFDQGDKG